MDRSSESYSIQELYKGIYRKNCATGHTLFFLNVCFTEIILGSTYENTYNY
ncbi:hypothetical protein KSZ_37880 [Dictyobacter formicarum]|uniref:Uncharacterized protein n=1 Tax=Dictyobacter formicarum TaxID=2778368 RepID=A0ABQ3VHY4_9CHLR|nr:hypothetical protein KSZ_37880 [Dictyobacter formicarum]